MIRNLKEVKDNNFDITRSAERKSETCLSTTTFV